MGNPWAPPDPSAPPAPPRQDVPGQPPSDSPSPLPRESPPPAPDPAGLARANRAGAWAAGALLVAVLLSGSRYPGLLMSPVAAVASLALSLVALLHAARAHARGPAIVLPVVLVLASGTWSAASAASLVNLDATREYQACEAAALTQEARRACDAELRRDLQDTVGTLLERTGRTPAP